MRLRISGESSGEGFWGRVLRRLLRTGLAAGFTVKRFHSENRVFGEGVKSARGEIAIPRRGDHTRNMFGTSLNTTDCKQTIALETAELMQ